MSAPTYNPQTGVFVSARTHRPILPGRTKNGYTLVFVDGKRVYAHRYAWFLVHGKWPTADIDHINGDRADNRIANLREATRSQNCAYSRKTNKHGLRGVTEHPDARRTKRYGAQIAQGGKYQFLGWHATPEEAHAAYTSAARNAYGEFCSPGACSVKDAA